MPKGKAGSRGWGFWASQAKVWRWTAVERRGNQG